MAKQCVGCSKEGGMFKGLHFQEIFGRDYCLPCGADYIKKVVEPVPVTTTSSIEGRRIKRYIDIESVEIVVGTGAFSEFAGDVSDFFGTRSTAFEVKLRKARKAAVDKLRYIAIERGGNAVVGVDLDFTEFSGNRVGIIANGTVVELEAA
jgi:uncharacterized protein YbjQ (UPF0145 family)